MGRFASVHQKVPVSDACPVCGDRAAASVASRDRYGKPLKTVACLGCGLLRTDPMPSEADLNAFYAAHYRQTYKGIRRPKPKHIYRAALLGASRLARLRNALPPPRRLLDVGSGSGEFCYLARTSGYDVTGIEADPEFAEHARSEYGVEIITGSAATADFAPGAFDAVTLFHVLEHLRDPVHILRAVHHWTSPPGVLFVEVPNVLSPNQHPAKRFHYAHVIGFSAASLRFCLNAAGWRVTELTLDPEERNLFALAAKDTGEAHEDSVSESPAGKPPRASYYLRAQTYRRWWRRMRQFAAEYMAAGHGLPAREVVARAVREHTATG